VARRGVAEAACLDRPFRECDRDRSFALQDAVSVDDREADQSPVLVVTEVMPFSRCVEIGCSSRGRADLKVKDVSLFVVQDVVELDSGDGDAHGNALRGKAVTIRPRPCS
jgi:hypothetical protein